MAGGLVMLRRKASKFESEGSMLPTECVRMIEFELDMGLASRVWWGEQCLWAEESTGG